MKCAPINTVAVSTAMKGVLRALRALRMTLIAGSLVAGAAHVAHAQDMTRVRDLTIEDKAIPVRLMGYGLVIGLDGTGDKSSGGKQGGMSVNSIVNLLRRFGVAASGRSDEDVRTSPRCSSPRKSLRISVPVESSRCTCRRSATRARCAAACCGSTPLLSDVGSDPVATAQGPVLMADLGAKSRCDRKLRAHSRRRSSRDRLPRPKFAQSSNLCCASRT